MDSPLLARTDRPGAVRCRGALLVACLIFWPVLAVANNLLLSAEERAWIRATPLIRYGVMVPDAAGSDADAYLTQAVTYMDALCARVGLTEQYQPLPSARAAMDALEHGAIDVLVVPVEDREAAPTDEKSVLAGRRSTLRVRLDWPLLAAILGKSHRALSSSTAETPTGFFIGEHAAVSRESHITGGELAGIVLMLAAGSATLLVIFWSWSLFRRRGLKREIERNEALFNAFFTASPTGMAILDRELRFVRINHPLARLHGVPTDDHLGRPLEQVLPALAAIVAPLMREVLVTGRSIHNVEVSGRTPAQPDSEVHWLVSFFPIPSPTGRNPMGVGEVVLDIGDRKKTELALRESENRLRNVSDHLPVAVFQYRFDEAAAGGGFSYLSEGIARVLHLDPRLLSVDPAHALECIHTEDRTGLLDELAHLRRQPEPQPSGEIEWSGRLKPGENGEVNWIQIRASLEIQASGRLSISGVVLDISQLKQVQQALERSRAELRQLGAHREGMVEREHQRLAREFHDELGQLLTTARMHLQLLARQVGNDPARAEESVRAIDAMIVDAYRSIKNIASDLRPAALNLGLTAAIEWLAERMLVPLGINCAIDCASAVDQLDDDYTITLFRIVQESLTNIVRHAAAQRVRIAIRHETGVLQLLVEDDGKGFDVRQVDRIKQFGLLGIAERVAALDGEIDLDSTPGAGTRIAVRLSNVPFKNRLNA